MIRYGRGLAVFKFDAEQANRLGEDGMDRLALTEYTRSCMSDCGENDTKVMVFRMDYPMTDDVVWAYLDEENQSIEFVCNAQLLKHLADWGYLGYFYPINDTEFYVRTTLKNINGEEQSIPVIGDMVAEVVYNAIPYEGKSIDAGLFLHVLKG